MKNLHHLLFPLFITFISFAQTPEKVSYQAILRDGEGILVTNKELSVNLSVLQGNESGIEVYTETHFTETNANGLVSLEIGSGQADGSVYSSIDWEDGPYFIKTETTVDGSTLTSISELLSVPYALHAKEASKVNGLTVATEVPENAVFTDNQSAKEVTIDKIPNLDADDVQQALENLHGTIADAGDMKQTAYDRNNDSIVDNASKVNGLTVGTNVPVDALFTDSQKGNEVDLVTALDVDGDGEPETTVEAALIELNKLLKDLQDEVKLSTDGRLLSATTEGLAGGSILASTTEASAGTHRPCLVEHEGQHYFGGIQESRFGSVCAYNHKDKPYYKTSYKTLDKDFLSKTKNADQTVLTYSASDGSENKLCVDQKGRYGYEKTSEEPKRCLFAVPFSNKYGSVTLTEGSSLNYEYLKLNTIRFIDDSDSGKEGQRYYRTVKDDRTYCAAFDTEGISFDGQYHSDKGTCHVNGKELQTGFFMYSGSPSESDGEHRILASSQLDAYKYQIGSVINGLVLFKIYNGIYYFLSKDNLSPTTWGCNDPLDLIAGTSSNLGTGHFNTTKIAAHSNCENAARVSLNYKEGDHTEFYLPSENELKAIYEIKDHLENIEGIAKLEGTYWSSTVDVEFQSSHGHRTSVEMDRVEVVDFDSDSGQRYGVSVNEELHVRPVLSMPSNDPELFFVTDENELHRSISESLETNPNYLRTWFEHNYLSPSVRYDDFTGEELLSIYMADLSIQCPDILKDVDTIDLTKPSRISQCMYNDQGGQAQQGQGNQDNGQGVENNDQNQGDENGENPNNGDQGGQDGNGNNNPNNNPGGNSDQNLQESVLDTLTFSNGRYIGQVKNGLPHGQGKMTYNNGDVYEGSWENGKRHGRAFMTYSNGDTYQGVWKRGKKNGFGIYTERAEDCCFGMWKNKNVFYKGLWESDRLIAKVTEIYKNDKIFDIFNYENGDVYQGNMNNDGKPDGHGTLTYANGKKYEGAWKDGKPDGHGKMTYENGDVYEGEWKDGKRHGQGTLTYANGKKHEGAWKDGKAHGKGKSTTFDGSSYEGDWENGKMHGQGKATFENGNKYQGEWKYGLINGQGTYTFKSGAKYQGEFENGQPHGQGTYTFKNGNKYVGAWKNHERHGKGTFTFKNGTKYQGEWEEGKMMKQVGTVTFSQEALGQIDKFLNKDQDNIKNICSICIEELKLTDSLSVLPCNHVYHKACIEQNENYNNDDNYNKCPNCRGEYNQRLDIEANSLIKQLDEYKNQNQQDQQDQNEGADQIIKEGEKMDDEQQLDDNQGGNIELIPQLEELMNRLKGQHDNGNVNMQDINNLQLALTYDDTTKIKTLIQKLNAALNKEKQTIITDTGQEVDYNSKIENLKEFVENFKNSRQQ